MKKEYGFSKLKEVRNPYPGKKKAGGILSQGRNYFGSMTLSPFI